MKKSHAKLLREFAKHSRANYKALKKTWKDLWPHEKMAYMAQLRAIMTEAQRRAEHIIKTQAITRRHAKEAPQEEKDKQANTAAQA